MKDTIKSYLKAVLIIFAILYVLYLIFEFTVLDSHVEVWKTILKVLLLALLLPLFSKKYMSKISSKEDFKRFEKNRNRMFIIIGSLVFIGILTLLLILLFVTKNII